MISPTITTREEAIDAIRQEVKRYGEPRLRALRIMIDSGISLADYRQAIQDGMTAHHAQSDQARKNGVVS